MNKLLFALYDTKGYMKAFSEYLMKKNFLVDSHLFTKMEPLTEFLQNNRPDILLLGQEVNAGEIRHLDHAGQVVVMSEGDMVAENMDTFPMIFKYQSAEKILQEIFQIVSEKTDFHQTPYGDAGSDTEFLGIYRPYGEPLPVQRVFSVNGGREKKSLFINMELLSGMEMGPGGRNAMRGLSELIFYIKQKNEKLPMKLKALVQDREGVDYLYPVEDYRDLYSIDREDVDRLLQVLANETGYERVVFDIGYLNDSSLYLLYCCDRVYVPRAKNSWEENQKRALENLLIREGLEDVVESIRYVS